MTILGDWERLAATLDDDMRLIYPHFYIENQNLYDKICGIGYLIKDLNNPETGLDWVSDTQINKILQENPSVMVLSKMLIVRLRLPWHEVNTEWLVGQEELSEHRDEYEVLETYIRVRPIGSNEPPHWVFPNVRQDFEENRDNFEVIETRYCVRWRWSDEEIYKLLEDDYVTVKPLIDKGNVHTYISE